MFHKKAFNYAQTRTKSEYKLLWVYLLGYYHPRKPLYGWYPDYYNPLARVVIEVNGSIHDRADIKIKDRLKRSSLASKGIYVLTISNKRADKSSLLLGLDVIAVTLIWPLVRLVLYCLRILKEVVI